MEGCKYCNKVNAKLELYRGDNIGATDCYVFKGKNDPDGTIYIENTKGMPAFITINYCPMCGRSLCYERE